MGNKTLSVSLRSPAPPKWEPLAQRETGAVRMGLICQNAVGPVLIASRCWPLSRSPDMFDPIKALFVQQFQNRPANGSPFGRAVKADRL